MQQPVVRLQYLVATCRSSRAIRSVNPKWKTLEMED